MISKSFASENGLTIPVTGLCHYICGQARTAAGPHRERYKSNSGPFHAIWSQQVPPHAPITNSLDLGVLSIPLWRLTKSFLDPLGFALPVSRCLPNSAVFCAQDYLDSGLASLCEILSASAEVAEPQGHTNKCLSGNQVHFLSRSS